MKILIIGFTKIKFMPYLRFYLDNINPDKNEIHILYWNRDLQEDNIENKEKYIFHEFNCFQEDDVAKSLKIFNFIKYRKFVKKTLKKEKFDFLIVLHSLPGVLIKDILKKYYKGKYIFDYRDSTYEKFILFKKIVGKIVKCSKMTFVSSNAFRRFLPEKYSEKIYTSHNLLMDSLCYDNSTKTRWNHFDKIKIAFWGFIRHESINKEIIFKVSRDDRFELHYYGREQQIARNLKKYCYEINADNVFFHGEYNFEDRYKFAENTDLIHNIYYDSNTMLAMGNKYYDGLIFKIPQLCMNGSYMGQLAVKYGVGIECSPYEENFTDIVYNYYRNLDYDLFSNSCKKQLNIIMEEYEKGKEKIIEIFN